MSLHPTLPLALVVQSGPVLPSLPFLPRALPASLVSGCATVQCVDPAHWAHRKVTDQNKTDVFFHIGKLIQLPVATQLLDMADAYTGLNITNAKCPSSRETFGQKLHEYTQNKSIGQL